MPLRAALHRWPAFAAALLAGLFAVVGARGQGFPACGELYLADAGADPGTGSPDGAALSIDVDLPVDGGTTTAGGGGAAAFLSHVASGPDRLAWLSDLDADPSGLGPDPNGTPGRGAVFEVDPDTGTLSLLSDGTGCDGSIAVCGASGVFVEPVGIAYRFTPTPLLAVVDLDADPSGLGPDSSGFAGHGAVFSLDPSTGTLSLLADGSDFPGLPAGKPSAFEDPVGVDFTEDGDLLVVDQLADPLDAGTAGAVFRVDPATGAVELLSGSPQFAGLRDVAAEPTGTALVLDRIARTVFRIDPSQPVGSRIVASLTPAELVDPAGIAVTGSGRIYLLDAAADPTGSFFAGAVFEVDPGLASVTPISSTADLVLPMSLAPADAVWIEAVNPSNATQGESPTVTLEGGPFESGLAADLGSGITVDATRRLARDTAELDLTLAGGASPGPRDLAVVNPSGRSALVCDAFTVEESPGCTPGMPVGPTLRVAKTATTGGPRDLRITWQPSGDPCATSFRVYRSFDPRPAVAPGAWPADPPFADVTALDDDGSATDATFSNTASTERLELYLVVEVGTSGEEGPSAHYGG